jgi:hypothetical protein
MCEYAVKIKSKFNISRMKEKYVFANSLNQMKTAETYEFGAYFQTRDLIRC